MGDFNKSEDHYDVAIVGAGMVGSSLALALSALPLKIALIDPYPQNNHLSPGFDARAVALSLGSTKIYQTLGLWSDLSVQATAINNIHVSDRGHLGICRLNAEQFEQPFMGQVIELESIGEILFDALAKTDVVQFIPATVEQLSIDKAQSVLTFSEEGGKNININARLVIAADGNNSSIRTMAGIESKEKPYNQQAVICTIQTQLAHNNVAYERFTENGPLAFLPLSDNRISVVWMLDADKADQYETVSDDDFIKLLQHQFGQRLGKITRLGKRYRYPLSLRTATTCVKDRLVLVGNAAQSLHPIAGQGLNLGLRDVAILGDCLRMAVQDNVDLGDIEMLSNYQQLRASDRQRLVGATDSMARLFTNPSKLLAIPRNAALMLMNVIPKMRTELAEVAMGISGHQGRLVRGQSLQLNEDATNVN